MSTGKKQNVLRRRAQSTRHAVGSRGDLLRRFASRATVKEQAPIRPFSANFGRGAAFVFAVVPLDEVGIYFRHRPEAGQFTSPPGATQRAGKYLCERQPFQPLP